MKKTRRIILRTETLERIKLRQASKITVRNLLDPETYQVVISKIEAPGKKIIFEAEIVGFIEIEETNEEVLFVCRKQ